MQTVRRGRATALALLVALCAAFVSPMLGAVLTASAAGTVTLGAFGTGYTQDFNSLASSGTANTTVPLGWEFSESGTSANTSYRAGTGSDNTGDTYSFGAAGNSERAFGGLRSGPLVPLIGAQFTNNTGSAIASLSISYTGEQWRLGQNTSGRSADRLDFQLSTDATGITNGTWTDYNALDFASPVVAGTVGAVNGNVAPNRTSLSFTISGLNIPNNASFWLRWADTDLIPGADDGLSVDDFSLTAQGVAPSDTAPSVVSTAPATGDTDVALNANITVNFSEPVNANSSSFTLVCSVSGTKALSVSATPPATFTLDPSGDFSNGDACTLTISATGVSDADTNDPPDNLPANVVVSFNAVNLDTAPAVSSTSPTSGDANVPLNANIIVNFSEPVNTGATPFTLVCSVSGANTLTVNAESASTFTLDPNADFSNGDACTLTILSAGVTDADSNDPPDNLPANVVVSFSAGDPCLATYTPIYQIQGSGATAAITGLVTTQGVVVGDYEGASPALRGFFIQDVAGDGIADTSDGIFVFDGSNLNSVSLGEIVRVTGTAGENQGQTQVSKSPAAIVKCGTSTVAPVDVTLPVPTSDFLERYEGMLVRLPQTLYVTEHFQLGRFGQVVLSSGGRLQQPTNVTAPGAPALALQAANNLNRIILDDASQAQNPDPILFARNGLPLSAANTLRGGDTATGIVGLLNFTWAGNAASGNAYRVRPINALGGSVNFVATNPRPATAPARAGSVRMVGMNLLNFFNTFDGLPDNVDNCRNGVGGASTDCRGADTQAEFDRQWPKTVAAIIGANPDILGVIEIENDGYGPDSAQQFLVEKLNADTGPGTYALIDVDAATGQANAMGTDAIKVGLIYKPAVVTPVGQTAALNSAAFVNGGDDSPRSRPALAQAFQDNSSGGRFVVSVNHFKSKGSACNAPDAGDGQGNCNLVRTNAAIELKNWLAADPTGTNEQDVLIIGDLNSYAKEDPITALLSAPNNYINLIETFLGPDAYSYAFDGQWGYLDHALGTGSLVPQIGGVAEWHINADEPSVLDYNTDFKTPNLQASLYAADQFRISDHDPVIVDLNLVDTPPNANAGGPYSVDEGQSITLNASGDDPDGTAVSFAWDINNDNVFETPGQSVTFAAVDGPNNYPVSVRVTDETGATAIAGAVVAVANVPPSAGPVSGPSAPAPVNTPVTLNASFSDPGVFDTHTATWNWGNGQTTAGVVNESNGSGSVSGSYSYAAPGVYTVVLTVTDKDGGSAQSVFEFVVVYNPSGGFVTGGGWINSPAGAYVADPTLAGKANFGFVSKYQKGATVPTGNTQFQFQAADFSFQSTAYEWLVIAGAKAQYKGTGTVNGTGSYGFMLTAIDGDRNGGSDKLRLKVWDRNASNAVVYDNLVGQSDSADPTTVLGGGSIVIHDGKVGKSSEGDEVEITDRLFLPAVGR